MKIVRIPPEIDILGVTYIVEYVDELETGDLVAQIHFTEGLIKISNDMSLEVQWVSFMHEVNHGILQGLNHSLNNQIYHDETFVEQTAQAWSQVVKQIVKWNIENDTEEEQVLDKEDERPLNIDFPGDFA